MWAFGEENSYPNSELMTPETGISSVRRCESRVREIHRALSGTCCSKAMRQKQINR